MSAQGTTGTTGDRTLVSPPSRRAGQGDNTRRVSPVPEGLSLNETSTAEPAPEYVRACIREQRCPYCGATENGAGRPFRLLANHTAHVHGVDRFALREAAGLPRDSDFICAPEHTERIRSAVLAPLWAKPKFRELQRQLGIARIPRLEEIRPGRDDGLCPRCGVNPRPIRAAGKPYCALCLRAYNREWDRKHRRRRTGEGPSDLTSPAAPRPAASGTNTYNELHQGSRFFSPEPGCGSPTATAPEIARGYPFASSQPSSRATAAQPPRVVRGSQLSETDR